MGERALWPAVAIIGMVLGAVVLLAYARLEVVAIVAILGVLFNGVGSLVGIIVYGKVAKVEANTNGSATAQNKVIQDQMAAQAELLTKVVEHLRTMVPIDAVNRDLA